MKLTTASFWEEGYQGIDFDDMHNHSIALFLQKYLQNGDGKSALEIGSYPGHFIPTIGRKGFQVSGIDFNARNSFILPEWLRGLNIKTGEFYSTDFFDFIKSHNIHYDLVCSFGFIEHFVNYQDVIIKHAKLVKDKGYLIITTPNFRGWIQNSLHKVFDKQNLALHNAESMDPKVWKDLLENAGFEIVFYGYFGDFWFWHGHEKLPRWKRAFLWVMERAIQRIRKMLWFQSPAFSAYAGIVAKRKTV